MSDVADVVFGHCARGRMNQLAIAPRPEVDPLSGLNLCSRQAGCVLRPGTLQGIDCAGRSERSRKVRIRGTGRVELRPACRQVVNDAVRRATSERGASVLCQFHLISRKLEQAARGDRQGRVASGQVYPLVGFIVTNLSRPAERVVAFYNKRGTCEQWIKEGKGAIKWTRLSCRTFAANAVRLQLHALAYNLGNFLRTLATPEPIKDWSLTSLKEKLIKIGAKVVSHGRYVAFQMAEVAIPRQMFQEILRLIAELRPQPPPAPA